MCSYSPTTVKIVNSYFLYFASLPVYSNSINFKNLHKISNRQVFVHFLEWSFSLETTGWLEHNCAANDCHIQQVQQKPKYTHSRFTLMNNN